MSDVCPIILLPNSQPVCPISFGNWFPSSPENDGCGVWTARDIRDKQNRIGIIHELDLDLWR